MIRKVLAVTAGLSLAACSGGGGGGGGGSSSGESTKALSIQGTFASLPSFVQPLYGFQVVPALASVFKVRCVTLSGPLAAGEGTVSTSSPYTFNVNMTTGLNAPIGCFLLSDDSIVATLSFGSEASMTGGTKPKTAYSPKPDSTLLALGSLNIAGGFVTPAGAITENGTGSKPSFASMTGTWTLSSIYTNDAENYIHPCDMDYDPADQPDLNTACRTNWSSKGVYIHQIGATDGTETRAGLGLWENQAALTACGGREGVELDSGWTATGSWTEGAFNFVTLDLSNIDQTMLSKARFKKSTHNGANNCPKDENQDELPGCDTANDCGDFFASYPAGEAGSREKARCMLNSLASGGDFGYAWGTACGARAQVDWAAANSATYDNDGSGCSDADCGGAVDFTPNDADPQLRMFFSELFIDGNVGTATESETFTCTGTTVKEDTAITVTQSSATAATFVVEKTMSFAGGTAQQQADCIASDTYIAESMGKVTRMKMGMTKQ